MNMHSMDPSRLLEKLEEEGQECRDCDHDKRIGVGRRFTCLKDNPDHPKASRSTCIYFIPKRRIKQNELPNGAMQRRM